MFQVLKEQFSQFVEKFSQFLVVALLMVVAVLLIIIGLLIWMTLRDGAPASVYLGIALAVLIAAHLSIKASSWALWVRDTAAAACIGFLLLTVLVAYVTVLSQHDVNDHTIEVLRSSELFFLHWQKQLDDFGSVAWIVVPLSLIALVFAGRSVAALEWAGKMVWLQRTAKYVLGGVTIAASFSMLASGPTLGQAKGVLIKTLTYIDKKEHADLLKAARLRAQTAALANISDKQKRFVASAANAILHIPHLEPAAQEALLIQAGRQAFTEDSAAAASGDRAGQPELPEKSATVTIGDGDPMALLARKLKEAAPAEALAKSEHAKYEAKRSEVVDQITASLLGPGNDLIKEKTIKPVKDGIANVLGELFGLPEGVMGMAVDPLLDKLSDVAYDKLTESFMEKLRVKQERFNRALEQAGPVKLAYSSVTDAARYLAKDLPAILIKRANANSDRDKQPGEDSGSPHPSQTIGMLQIPDTNAPSDEQLKMAEQTMNLFAAADNRAAPPSLAELRQRITVAKTGVLQHYQEQEKEAQEQHWHEKSLEARHRP